MAAQEQDAVGADGAGPGGDGEGAVQRAGREYGLHRAGDIGCISEAKKRECRSGVIDEQRLETEGSQGFVRRKGKSLRSWV